jgi:hypothetical protein
LGDSNRNTLWSPGVRLLYGSVDPTSTIALYGLSILVYAPSSPLRPSADKLVVVHISVVAALLIWSQDKVLVQSFFWKIFL